MKLKTIVATAATELEANLIFTEIAKTHAFIEFIKIDGCQVTVIYEPDQERLDRINREAEQKKATLPVAKKSAKQLAIEDLEAKVKQLGLDKDLFVTVTAVRSDKPQEYAVHNIDWNLPKPTIFKSKSAIAVSRKLTKIHKERQAAKVGHTLARSSAEVKQSQSKKISVTMALKNRLDREAQPTIKLTVGDTVTLKPDVKPVECNDFHTLPYCFTSTDIGTLVSVKSPRMRSKPGYSKYQAVVNFSKEGERAYLTARVELSDLLLA